MALTTRTNVQCPRCGNMFDAMVNPLVDVGQDPAAKVRLLNGQLNLVQCPRCGTTSQVVTPMVYHDPQKELLITFAPMGVAMPKPQQEKLIGDLIRDVTNRLPPERRKGYLFSPRTALTLQGLIDQVLQADGVTPEMMEQQRAKMRLVEQLMQAPDDALDALIRDNDAQIDAPLLQIMALMAQRMMAEGRPDLAQHVVDVQQRVVELSTLGQELIAQSEQQEQTVQEVARAIQALGQKAQRSDFLNLALEYADDDERLQALVGLVRPAFDPVFFQELTMRIAQAPSEERDRLESLRDRLTDLAAAIDQQTQLALQESAQLLQAFLSAPDPDAVIQENLPLIDDTFMAVLSANIQEAERQRDIAMSARLKELYNRILGYLRENMGPELRFVNELLSAPSDDEARRLLREQGNGFEPDALLPVLDAVEEMLAARGDQGMLRRLDAIRAEVEK